MEMSKEKPEITKDCILVTIKIPEGMSSDFAETNCYDIISGEELLNDKTFMESYKEDEEFITLEEITKDDFYLFFFGSIISGYKNYTANYYAIINYPNYTDEERSMKWK